MRRDLGAEERGETRDRERLCCSRLARLFGPLLDRVLLHRAIVALFRSSSPPLPLLKHVSKPQGRVLRPLLSSPFRPFVCPRTQTGAQATA